MVCAAEPEAPVDEDGYPSASEHYVAAPTAIHREWSVNAVAQTTRMQDSPKRNLWPGVAGPIRWHRARCGSRGWRRTHRTGQAVTAEKSDRKTDSRSGRPSTCLSFTGCTGGFSRCAMLWQFGQSGTISVTGLTR